MQDLARVEQFSRHVDGSTEPLYAKASIRTQCREEIGVDRLFGFWSYARRTSSTSNRHGALCFAMRS